MKIQRTLSSVFRCVVASALMGLMACSSAKIEETQTNILTAENETKISQNLMRSLQKKYVHHTQPILAEKLEAILDKLIAVHDKAFPDPIVKKATDGSSEEAPKKIRAPLKRPKVQVFAAQDIFIGAGVANTIYLSSGILRTLKYENELVFLLATQLVLLKNQVPQGHYIQLEAQGVPSGILNLSQMSAQMSGDSVFLATDWFQKNGFFDFGVETYLNAEKDAVRWMHEAWYDQRGAVSILQTLKEYGAAQGDSTFFELYGSWEDLLSIIREEVAKLPPLRDPIVKTDVFEKIQALAEKLPESKKAKKHGPKK